MVAIFKTRSNVVGKLLTSFVNNHPSPFHRYVCHGTKGYFERTQPFAGADPQVVFSGREMKVEEKSARQGDRKKGFYLHLGLYAIVNIILIVAWARTGTEANPVPWFVFPLVGWGILVVWNYLEAFVWPEETGWEKRQVEKEFERLRKGSG